VLHVGDWAEIRRLHLSEKMPMKAIATDCRSVVVAYPPLPPFLLVTGLTAHRVVRARLTRSECCEEWLRGAESDRAMISRDDP
jgi:hypothetical protein